MIRSFTYLLLAGATAGLTGFNAVATGASPAQLPFYFESNGSTFQASGPGAQCVISATGAALTLRDGSAAPATVRLQFAGANRQAAFHGEAAQPGKINHLTGNQWSVGNTAFGQVQANDIYPGISAVFYGNARRLEYDINVAPGAKPETIALQFEGADKISLSSDGQLLLAVAGREISQPAPVIYQTIGGTRHEITGGYRLVDAKTVSFDVGGYDHSQPLVIDPFLSYSTYFGGNNTDQPRSVKVDSQGNIYLAGWTLSTIFTNTIPAGGYQTNYHGGTSRGDGFIAKFDTTGTNLVFFTYLGGHSEDGIEAMTLDNANNVYVCGYTESTDFPVTNLFLPLTNKLSGQIIPYSSVYPTDAFVAELAASGSNLVYSGYLGGEQADDALAIALDTNRNIVYVTGYSYSTNFPVSINASTNAYSQGFKAYYSQYYDANAFVAAIGTNYTNAFGVSGHPYYSTYFGGTNFDYGTGIAVDGAGYVYVTGYTSSTNFPTKNTFTFTYLTTNVLVAYNTNHVLVTNSIPVTNVNNYAYLNGSTNTATAFYNYGFDAFVTKFQPGCTGLVYSTFLGGTNNDEATGISVDAAGNAFVIGWTTSTNFPNTVANLVTNQNFVTNNLTGYFTTNSFLVELTNSVAGIPGIVHSAVFGGLASDIPSGIALDAADNVYITGATTSTNFPATRALATPQATNSGGNDAFVFVVKSDWSGLLYSTYLGGSLDDYGNAIAVDGAGNVYVTGQTFSSAVTSTIGFPVWNAVQTVLNGTSDGFLAKIVPAAPSIPLVSTFSRTNLVLSWKPNGLETPAMFFLEANTNLLTSNWVSVSNAVWTTNSSGVYQFNLGYTNRTQFLTNKAKFFRLHSTNF